MTNNVNGIGLNTKGLNSYVAPKSQGEQKAEEKAEGQQPQAQGAQVKPEDVLTYMAQNAAVNAQVKTPASYDVAKYVTPEQAQRIAGFVASFEGEVAKGLLAINKELEGVKVSDAAKLELAAKLAEKN